MGLTQYSTPFDIWSIGCILVEICTMRHLFGANDEQGALAKMYYIFGSFNDKVLPGYKNFPNSNLIKELPERNGIGLVEYSISSAETFSFLAGILWSTSVRIQHPVVIYYLGALLQCCRCS